MPPGNPLEPDGVSKPKQADEDSPPERGGALRKALAAAASPPPTGGTAPVRALELDDRTLVQQSLEGRPEAFDLLVRRHGAAVHSYLARMTGRQAQADDLYQETFLRAFRHRARWRADAPFVSWLFAIARRMYLTARGRGPQRYEEELPDNMDLEDHRGTPETDAVRAQLQRAVREAVMKLPPDMREVILLSRYAGLTYREIGQIVGASEEAVKLRAFRAMRKMAEALPAAHKAGGG